MLLYLIKLIRSNYNLIIQKLVFLHFIYLYHYLFIYLLGSDSMTH